jgi:hypothetical protein
MVLRIGLDVAVETLRKAMHGLCERLDVCLMTVET